MKAKSRVSMQLSPFMAGNFAAKTKRSAVERFLPRAYEFSIGTGAGSATSTSPRKEVCVAPTAQQFDSRTGAKE